MLEDERKKGACKVHLHIFELLEISSFEDSNTFLATNFKYLTLDI